LNQIEKAIRTALEKGDAGDPAFREKVYRAVHSVIEKGLQERPDVTPESARERRDLLRSTITRIESEFGRPKAEANGSYRAPEVELDVPISSQPAREHEPISTARREPVLDFEVAEGGQREPGAAPERIEVDADPRRAGRRRRFGLLKLLAASGVLAVAALGLWWAADAVMPLIAERGRTLTSPSPLRENAGRVAPTQGEASPRGDWITVFSPSDPTTVTAPPGASAEIVAGDRGEALRISSGRSGAAVLFDVAPGTLDRIAGRRVLFDIVASAEESRPSQIAVTCDFGELGDCGRNRYNVGNAPAEFLLDIILPDRSASAAGTIAINADIENEGKTVDVHEIRVSIAD
jgi:hypothetical protein